MLLEEMVLKWSRYAKYAAAGVVPCPVIVPCCGDGAAPLHWCTPLLRRVNVQSLTAAGWKPAAALALIFSSGVIVLPPSRVLRLLRLLRVLRVVIVLLGIPRR